MAAAALAGAFLFLSACSGPSQSTASKAEAPTAAPAATSAKPGAAPGGKAPAGTYAGKVSRGYNITFEVTPDGNQVQKVTGKVLESCTGSTSTTQTTIYLEGPFAIGEGGQVLAEGKDEYDYTYKFTAAFDGKGGASGTILQKGVMAGTACTTYDLNWEATRQ